METSTATLREQGLQALREGNADGAVEYLARAVMADAQDAEAQAFLGVAYSQKGLHAQAARALQTAVELRPNEARYRFNLGVALENGGDPSGASGAYQETLRLNPEHPHARAKLLKIGIGTEGVPTGPASTSPAAAPSRWSSEGANGAVTAPPGSVQCPRCRQWSKPGMSCEWCSASLKGSGASGSAPWLQSSYASSLGEEAAPAAAFTPNPGMTAREALNQRWKASFIDGILCSIMRVAVTTGVGFIVGFSAGTHGAGMASKEAEDLAQGIGTLVALFFSYAYYVTMLSVFGQTLGKKAMGLRVVGPDGEKPTFGQALIRETVGKLLSSIPLCLGFLSVLWDGKQQTWHDKMARTYVERIG